MTPHDLRRRTVVAFAILVAAGCATHEAAVKDRLTHENIAFVGQSRDQLLTMKGSPNLKDTLSDGNELWTYRRTRTGVPQGTMEDYPSSKPGSEPMPVTWVETVVFVMGRDGVVKGLNVSVE